MSKIFIGLILAMSIALLFVFNLYGDKVEENANLQKDIDSYEFQIESMNDKITAYSSDMLVIRTTNKKVSNEYLRVISNLNEYKNREDIVIKRPTLVQRKIQKSFDTYLLEMQCLTGNTQVCVK